tara:strand:- start:652 stop:2112 length:1461 start_codon:yes stop_codon:yes gene_type:complete
MAGEGLFFTGVVLKNNRDLLKEEEARQRLAMDKERLEMQKQEAAARRAEARRKNLNVPTKDYDTKALLPDLAKDFQGECTSFKNQVNEDALAINDGDLEARSRFNEGEGNLKNDLSLYTDISTSMSGYRNLVKADKGNTLKTTDDGEYLFEVNYRNYINAIQENPSADRLELEKQFPIRSGMINETKFSDPNNAFYTAEASNREGSTSFTDESGFTRQKSSITDDQFGRATLEVQKGLTPDSNGNFDNPDQKKIYIGKEGLFKVGDDMLSGPEAFALERKNITSVTDEDGSSPFIDKLMPGSGPENEELRNEYIQYLAEKYEEQAREIYPSKISTSKRPARKGEEGLTQKDVDFLSGPSKSTLSYGGVNLKFDAGMYDDVTDRNIEVNIVPESLLPGQGELQEFFEKQYKDEVGDTNKSVVGKVTRLGLTDDNVKVVSVKFGQKEYLIPYESMSGEIEELKKTSVGYKIGQFEPQDTSAEGDALFE